MNKKQMTNRQHTTDFDAPIHRTISGIRAAWNYSARSGREWMDGDTTIYLEANVNLPERTLRHMRPKTVAGALAKVRFARWFARECGSDDPAYVGLDVAVADLQSLVGRSATA